MTRYAIIGDGAAGTTAAFSIRKADPRGDIHVLCDDPNPAYYRAALTNYLIGELREEQLFAVPPNFYSEFRVQRHLERVAAVDSRQGTLSLASGGAPFPYDQLLIAAGASPNLPPFPGAELPGVMTMRTLQDARTVMDLLRAGRIRHAVVIGGGPLGIEWVQGLRSRGVEVTYVLRGDMFMEGVLDRRGSDLVLSRLRSAGVDVRLNEEVARAAPGKDGRLGAVELKGSGRAVQCQLVGVAIGIRGNVTFLAGSGIEADRGVPVDPQMRTNVPNVFAAGDIASVLDPATGKRRGLGLWEPARLQGRTAGINMSGGTVSYDLGVQYNATRLWDLDFAGIGRTIEAEGDRVVVDFPTAGGRIRYRKLVLSGNRLAGALLLGQRTEAVRARGLQLLRIVEMGADVSGVADQLLDADFDVVTWIESLEESVPERESSRAAALSRAGTPIPSRAAAAAAVPSRAELMRPSRVVRLPSLPVASTPVAPVGRLTVEQTGQRVDLRAVTRIGRSPDNDVVPADDFVSGYHAEVRAGASAFTVVDAGSRNGTFVNEAPIISATPLRDGDVIRVGYTNLVVSLPQDAAPSAGFGHGPQPEALPAGSAPSMPRSAPRPSAVSLGPLGHLELGGRRFELGAQVSSIGRDPQSDVPVDDSSVSYMHAQVTRMGTDLYLRDVGSRNGTYVNRRLVTVPHLLVDGDVIHVGETDLVFHGIAGLPTAPTPFPSRPGPAQPPAAPAPAPPPPAAPREHPHLVVRSGPLAGASFALGAPSARVGRDPSADVVLDDDTVSRSHARFDLRPTGWTVTDLGSTNGTHVAGRRLGPNEETAIPFGAVVRVGEVELTLEAS